MKKRLISYILCFCMAFQSLAPSCFALSETLGLNDVQQTKEAEVVIHNEKVNAKGNLEIDLKFSLPIENVENANIGFYLKNESGASMQVDLNGITDMVNKQYTFGTESVTVSIRKLDREGNILTGINTEDLVVYYGITVYGLDRGTYALELFGNGYKSYHTNITLDDYSKRISLSNEKGMFEVGDVNGDGQINDADIDHLLSHFGESSFIYDLNRDGNVDIADLNYITAIISGTKKNATIVDTTAILDETKIEMVGGNGTLSDILTDNGSVFVTANDNGKITESNPAILTLNLKDKVDTSELRLEVGETNVPEKLEIIVTDEDGKEHIFEKNFEILNDIHTFTDKANSNTIVIDLKGQIAIKKVTIKIKESSTDNLAEIGKVEFLNNVYTEVPIPTVDRPTNVQVEEMSESFKITYNHATNVTGYEIIVKEMNGDQVVKNNVYQTTYDEFKVTGLKNYKDYLVCVQSVNEEWKSGCTDAIKVTPKPTRKPPMVDMVTLNPVYAGFNIGYKKMDDTLTYNIYYRMKGESEFTKITGVTGNSYQLRNLKPSTEYEIAISGTNELGEGPKSNIAIGTTKDYVMPDTYNYGLINRPNGTNKTDYIKSVTLKSGKNYPAENMYALVDNDYESYWQADTWDTGGFNVNANAGIVVEFEQDFEITQMFLVPKDDTASFFYVRVYYDENGTEKSVNASITSATSPNGQKYYKVILQNKVNTSKIRLCLANYQAGGNNALREIKFYQYDSLEDDIKAIYKDDLHLELQDGVTEETIKSLEERVNTKEEASGEYHPNRSALLKDLEYARQILQDTAIREIITVDQTISNNRNGHLGFAMSISDYQPLGIAVRAGEKITVYVGTKNKVMPQIVFTQYYAEANVWTQTETSLKVGQNIIEVPKIGTMAEERGGSVYVRYPSSNVGSEVKIRVSGGTKIPVLDVHDLYGIDKTNAIKTYIEELEAYSSKLPQLYEEKGLTFNERTSVLNSTEIVTEHGLFSFPATAVKNAIATGLNTLDEKVNRVNESTSAFDEMVEMFYRHKGLTQNPNSEEIYNDAKDQAPAARINIRYMRMFDGAFMYAGGLHIGIGYGSVGGLLHGTTYQDSFNGYFGWGISHEIGHQINQGKLAYAEVTNNIYALLAQTANDKNKSRLETSNIYPKIYEKVTSNTLGKPGNVFVHLGMYWQLHLAYDDNKTFEDQNSIYAKINHLTRTKSLSGNSEDLLVMYASEAAGKNLVPFFKKWGLTPSETAIEYASQFPEESRDIWYLNDESRRYRLEGGSAMASDTKVEATITEADNQNKRFTLSFNVNKDAKNILGYEIIRNGEPIAFVTENTFIDQIGAMNNRAITYQVVAYDYLLNKTEAYVLDEVKLAHDGTIKKNNFTINSNTKAVGEIVDNEDETIDTSKLTVNNLIDGDPNTYFKGTEKISKFVYNNNKVNLVIDDSNAYVIINLNTKMPLSGIKYQAATENGLLMEHTISKYNVYVSKDGSSWTLAKTGTFHLTAENNYTEIVYFDKEGTTGGNQLWTYNDISYVKIESVGNKNGISGAEIDLIAPPGDNVDLSNETIGKLKEPFVYEEGKDPIPAGSVVFKGNYRGNPAFNAMLIVDANDENKVYDGENFLFAKLTDQNDVTEIADGIWFYVVDEETYKKMVGTNVRARLYRVNDAVTLEGQRLTSTSLTVTDLPSYDNLPDMEIVDTTKGTN